MYTTLFGGQFIFLSHGFVSITVFLSTIKSQITVFLSHEMWFLCLFSRHCETYKQDLYYKNKVLTAKSKMLVDIPSKSLWRFAPSIVAPAVRQAGFAVTPVRLRNFNVFVPLINIGTVAVY